MTLKTTLDLDEHVTERIRRVIPQRGLSQLVNDLLQQKVAELEQAEIERQMYEGYLAIRAARKALNEEWQVIDGGRHELSTMGRSYSTLVRASSLPPSPTQHHRQPAHPPV